MRRQIAGLIVCLVAPLPVIAQTQGPAPASGIASEWDIRPTLRALAKHSEQLPQLLDSFRVNDWVAKGASAAYKQQMESARVQAQSITPVVGQLEKNVEKLSVVLEVFFRLQSIDDVLASLQDGVTKYQNPALAELLQGFLNENSNARQQLRQYLTDLAVLKEQEYQVMDKEAQRCRGQLMQQTPAPGKAK